MGGTKEQSKVLAPMVAYFETKRIEREDKDVADKRFIRSVQDLLRAEEQDQTQWARRRRRIAAARATNKSIAISSVAPSAKSTGSKPSHSICHAEYQQHPGRRKHPASRSAGAGLPASQSSKLPCVETTIATPLIKKEEGEGIAPRLIEARRGRQPSSGCPAPAVNPSRVDFSRTESPRKNANKNVPNQAMSTRTSTTRRRQEQRTGDRRQQQHAGGLDLTQAMTKIGQLRTSLAGATPSECHDIALEMALLYLVLSDPTSALKNFQIALKPSPERILTQQEKDKQEVQQRKLILLDEKSRAQALAVLRTEEAERKREQDELEAARRKRAAMGVYQCLLEMKEPVAAAEAARVRLDMCNGEAEDDERMQVRTEIHETLLRFEGLIEAEATNQGAWLTESAGALTDLHASILQSLCGNSSHAPLYLQPSQIDAPHALSIGVGAEVEINSIRLDGAGGQNDRCLSAGGSAVSESKLSIRGSETADAGVERGESLERGKTTDIEQSRRLRDLGRVLACKRQFTASRQAFEDAIQGGPEEECLRERHRCRTKGFYLDMALNEASPSMQLDIVSRWQGGVEADAICRRDLPDHTGFTGAHRGAETLVAAVPPAGWAKGVSDLPYADRLSRARTTTRPLQEEKEDVAEASASAGSSSGSAVEEGEGILLGHKVSTVGVVMD